MSHGQSVHLDFHSTLDLLDVVQAVGEHVGKMAGLDEEALHWVGVAVRESVVNAVKHGNCYDVQKRVHVEFAPLDRDTPSGLSVRIRDEGCGFDPATIPDPLAPENLLKPSGRGIFLIRSFMDEMELQPAPEGGMEVLLVKRANKAEC